MAKQLACGDLIAGCRAVLRGKDEKELLQKASEHARSAHGMQQISPDLAAKARGAMKDVV